MMKLVRNNLFAIVVILVFLGIIDAGYLTYEHYSPAVAPCSVGAFADCGAVLNSTYSVIYGVPLALLGLFHYCSLFVWIVSYKLSKRKLFADIIILQTLAGLLFSGYLMYLQLLVIGSICIYCTASALISTLIFITTHGYYFRERKRLSGNILTIIYTYLGKPIFFSLNPENVHEAMLNLGRFMGNSKIGKSLLKYLLSTKHPKLEQKIDGIRFDNPIGLAAGFDYDAKLTQVLGSIDFGFMTCGTITNMEYGGNPKPMLGRLPKSKSLMVNKGFKSLGAPTVSNNLRKLKFNIPVGISIGRTNSSRLKTQKQSVADIVSAFNTFEKAKIKNSYYELNISCPNLFGDIEFYSSDNLKELLNSVDKLKIKKPIYIKMPIEKNNREVLRMLKIIAQYKSIKGVIFGNLQKNRKDKSLVQDEVKKFKKGNFSGKPTYKRSNELISLAYSNYSDRFTIIGCGGVFSAEDAWEKITRGASLIQLITGMVFVGPQLISQINFGLEEKLKREGMKNIKDAVGYKKL